jgi:hypothetical protein
VVKAVAVDALCHSFLFGQHSKVGAKGDNAAVGTRDIIDEGALGHQEFWQFWLPLLILICAPKLVGIGVVQGRGGSKSVGSVGRFGDGRLFDFFDFFTSLCVFRKRFSLWESG